MKRRRTQAPQTVKLPKFDLPPEGFIFYPAQTWPHKNHLRLLEAIQRLRTRHGLEVSLVCTGGQTGAYPEIARRVAYVPQETHTPFDFTVLDFVMETVGL